MEEERQASDKTKKGTAKKKDRRPKEVRVYKSWCKRCGICAAFCPTKALEMGEDGHPVWKNPDQCIGCRMCEYRCPDFAIEVIPKEDIGNAKKKD